MFSWGRMELCLCYEKLSGSTNRVGNTVLSANGMDISPCFFRVASETAHDVAE